MVWAFHIRLRSWGVWWGNIYEAIADDELDAPISAQEVYDAIRNLKTRKAAGVDGISD